MATEPAQGARAKSTDRTGGGTSESTPTKPTDPSPQTPGEEPEGSPRTKLYVRRWFMLLLFSSYSLSNNFQWIHYSVISNITVRYYRVSILAVDWLSMVYMLTYIPLIFPTTWILDRYGSRDRYGLRVVGLLGSSLNCIGAWLKVAGVGRERFRSPCSPRPSAPWRRSSSSGCLPGLPPSVRDPGRCLPPRLLVSLASQLGIALGFLIPPVLVPNAADIAVVERGMDVMMFGTAGVTTLLFILVIIFFREKPPIPPSPAQASIFESEAEYSYIGSVKRLVKSVPFVLLIVTYGVNSGSFYAISTLLNQVVLSKYPGEEVNVGRIGLTIVLTGLLGSVLCGIWLDRTRTYKGTTVVVYILSFLCMTAFTFTLDLGYLAVVFATAGALGFFMTGYLPLGFEFAAEITYPESEGTSSGLLNASAQTFGIALTLFMGYLVNNVSTLAGSLCLCVTLFIGAILTALIKSDLKRLRAQQSGENTNAESKTTAL
ncbi:feline leukemia virus subgroup C receptor-related protein 1-like [Branchiostoma floridae]|uniref:Feline leukemia virus subgroup C receptor-related protein 1-like n=1 Tax=Branchiostoma floridae TaxID=7739 RepID=A0A9J7MI14_BRAFL|nr:feline leukemia virus subgroup C receptor-related protein 1-like [Branchiostoma floridae]